MPYPGVERINNTWKNQPRSQLGQIFGLEREAAEALAG
jgi:hypothetical protein